MLADDIGSGSIDEIPIVDAGRVLQIKAENCFAVWFSGTLVLINQDFEPQ
jgi:hypothetical protein